MSDDLPKPFAIPVRSYTPMRIVLQAAGAVAIVVASFFGTLFVMDYLSARSRDQTRVQNVVQIRDAIENFHNKLGGYPTELKSALVGGGFLKAIPADPLWANTDKDYQYYSDGRNNYGLLIWLEQAHGDVPAGIPCRTGLGAAASEMWGKKLDCPF
jgi:hypothetical protein